MLTRATDGTRQQLVPFREALAGMRGLYSRSGHVLDVSQLLKEVEQERERVLSKVRDLLLRGSALHITYVVSQCVLIRGVTSFQGWSCTRKHTLVVLWDILQWPQYLVVWS